MKYISDDGKVFETEQECLNHENQEIKRLEEERIQKEKLEMERKKMQEAINKKYEELQELLSEYDKKYVMSQKPYFAPVYELMNMLCG